LGLGVLGSEVLGSAFRGSIPTTNKKASGQYNSPGMLLDLATKNLYELGLRDFGFVELKKSDFFHF
jgi:hypothetical protein